MSDIRGIISTFKNKLYLWSAAALLFSACNEEPTTLNTPPYLSLKGFDRLKTSDGRDSLLIFHFFIEDEDGDIGLGDGDTNAPFTYGQPWFYNLWVIQRDWSNGSPQVLRIPGSSDTIETGARLPDMRSDFRDKYISADIQLSLRAEPYPGLKPTLVQFEFQLFDRKLNASQRIQSDKIPLKL